MAVQIEVYYENGRIVCFPDTAFSAQFGASVLDDINIRFDANLQEDGLIVELRHHSAERPAEDDFGYKPDPRGFPANANADAWVVLATPEEACDVIAVRYNDKLVIKRIGTELVNLQHLNALASLYFDDEGTMATLLMIASLYHILEDERRRQLAASIYEPGDEQSELKLIAEKMGIPEKIVSQALEFELYRESQLQDDAEGDAVYEEVGE